MLVRFSPLDTAGLEPVVPGSLPLYSATNFSSSAMRDCFCSFK
jgi:hypothetical protein